MAKRVGKNSGAGSSFSLGKTPKSDAEKKAEASKSRVKKMHSWLSGKLSKDKTKSKDVRKRRVSIGSSSRLKSRFAAIKSDIITETGEKALANKSKTYVKVDVIKNNLKVSSDPLKESEKEPLADKLTSLTNDIFDHKNAKGTLLSNHTRAQEYINFAIMQQVDSMEDQQAARAFVNGDLSFQQLYVDKSGQHGTVLINSESENGDLVSFQLEFNFVVRQEGETVKAPAPQRGEFHDVPPQEGETVKAPAPQRGEFHDVPPQEGETVKAPAPQRGEFHDVPPQEGETVKAPAPQRGEFHDVPLPKTIEGSSSSSKGKGKTESKTWAEVSFKGSLGPKIKDSELSANERETLISKLENSLKRSIFKSKAFDASDFKDNKGAQDLFINEVKEAILNIDDNVVKRGIAKADTGNIKVTDVHVNNRGKSGDLSIGVKIIGGQGNIDFNIEWNIVNPALRPKA